MGERATASKLLLCDRTIKKKLGLIVKETDIRIIATIAKRRASGIMFPVCSIHCDCCLLLCKCGEIVPDPELRSATPRNRPESARRNSRSSGSWLFDFFPLQALISRMPFMLPSVCY